MKFPAIKIDLIRFLTHQDDSAFHCAPLTIYVFICLFVRGLSSRSRIFHSYGDVSITDEGLPILTYARHSWSLSSEDYLSCHTYILWHGASVYNGHIQGPVTLTPIFERLAAELSLPVLKT